MPTEANTGGEQAQEPTCLSELIGEPPDVAIFKRFRKTSVECILYQSAKLQKLEADFLKLCPESDRNFTKLAEADPAYPAQRKMEEIIGCKSAFDRALLQYRQMLGIPPPASYDLSFVQQWLRYESGAWKAALPSRHTWLEDSDGLLGLQSGEDDLFVAKFITELVAPLIRSLGRWFNISRRPHGSMRSQLVQNYRADARVRDNAVVFSILIGSLLLGASIIALYYIRSDVGRLVFVMAFSAAFVICLRIFTACRKIEIFATAVALASVQVVFIGTSG